MPYEAVRSEELCSSGLFCRQRRQHKAALPPEKPRSGKNVAAATRDRRKAEKTAAEGGGRSREAAKDLIGLHEVVVLYADSRFAEPRKFQKDLSWFVWICFFVR